VITAMISQYFNVFVLIVQAFQKIPSLKEIAPTQSEAPFAVVQIVTRSFSARAESAEARPRLNWRLHTSET
jgi:hypothetical protein